MVRSLLSIAMVRITEVKTVDMAYIKRCELQEELSNMFYRGCKLIARKHGAHAARNATYEAVVWAVRDAEQDDRQRLRDINWSNKNDN